MASIRDGRSGFARGFATALVLLAGTAASFDDGARKSETATCACCTAASKAGGLSGIWAGEYKYGEGSGQRPVAFTAYLFQDGDRIRAMIREANTFGDERSPWLHATAEGRVDEASKSVKFTKTYDGTGGQSHEVVYKGALDPDTSRILSGTWDISGLQGTFTMRKSAVE